MSTPNDPEKRFIVDVMLGKLAKWLRVLGFDAKIAPLKERSRIESLMAQGFIPVTRSEKWRSIEGLVFIRGNDPFEQLKELISRLDIRQGDVRPFSRCSICNAELSRIPREAALGNVPDFVFETVTDFRQCLECRKIYWPGSHKGRMLDRLQSLLGWKPNEMEEESDG
jgi:uncharacterized protein